MPRLTRMGIPRLANAKSKRRGWLWLLLLALVAATGAALWFSSWGERMRGDALAGTAYGARVACSCHFVAGRKMGDCEKDKLSGMGIVRFSADEASKSVTANVPLIASATARFRDGYGCVLEPWDTAQRG